MAFELKDLLTPAASLLAVWLTARFTLNREIRKKELEIRVDRLEKLSADCDEVLSQLINYAGFISGLVQSRLLLLTPTQSKARIPIQEFSEDKDLLDNSKLAPDREKGRRCEHGLRFHHYQEWQKWDAIVPKLQNDIYDFFMITRAGEIVKDLKNQSRTQEDCEAFIRQLSKWQKDADTLRKQLLDAMSSDFHELTKSKPPSWLR
ncbi:TPA: hypothetical protein ACM4BF_003589 [Escherichia coli]|uniref:hypothetical protein n=1 Tax=Enterobacteriaceae TaxID=543 RepID=UPI00179F3F1F|nr:MULTISPECIES: hypothetical protein [Enterobacteriaceae]EFH3035697.1 hypothetical protein [Escherichia coli]EGT0653154.1 hypothetical protein [Citrobacter freundii]EID2750005.1 hypothetical protein [Escherichia coli]EKU0541847.1 hypothetical protein [Citrobacter koseri]EKU8894100.1 hypothetical protein [Citrobacter koseri]